MGLVIEAVEEVAAPGEGSVGGKDEEFLRVVWISAAGTNGERCVTGRDKATGAGENLIKAEGNAPLMHVASDDVIYTGQGGFNFGSEAAGGVENEDVSVVGALFFEERGILVEDFLQIFGVFFSGICAWFLITGAGEGDAD